MENDRVGYKKLLVARKVELSLFIFLFFFFYLRLTTQRGVQESVTLSQSHDRKSRCHITLMLHDGSHDKCGKVVHRPCSSCISSVGKSNGNSIEFSLSIAEQRTVGFIPAWSLAFLY